MLTASDPSSGTVSPGLGGWPRVPAHVYAHSALSKMTAGATSSQVGVASIWYCRTLNTSVLPTNMPASRSTASEAMLMDVTSVPAPQSVRGASLLPTLGNTVLPTKAYTSECFTSAK